MTAGRQGTRRFAFWVENQLQVPVADETGLTGVYDFTLDFLPAQYRQPNPSGEDVEVPPDLIGALQDQLGLTLNAKKLPRDILIVDHADKVPTEN